MKALRYFIFSFGVLLMCFQNALVMVDYHLHRDFYEKMCINKEKPALDCHGKCQMKKETEQENKPFTLVKFSFQYNALPTDIPIIPHYFSFPPSEEKPFFGEYLQNTKQGFPSQLLRPPSNFV